MLSMQACRSMLAGMKRVNSIPWVSEGGREPAHPNCLSRSVACRSARCSCLGDLPRVASPYASAGRLPRSRMRRSMSPRFSFSAACRASSCSIALASSCVGGGWRGWWVRTSPKKQAAMMPLRGRPAAARLPCATQAALWYHCSVNIPFIWKQSPCIKPQHITERLEVVDGFQATDEVGQTPGAQTPDLHPLLVVVVLGSQLLLQGPLLAQLLQGLLGTLPGLRLLVLGILQAGFG